MKSISKMMVAVAVGGMMAMSAEAVPYTFYLASNNGNTDVGSQLLVDVTASGSDVLFMFSNSGPVDSSITDIYFDDDNLMAALLSFNEGPGVDFAAGATPANLPGGSGLSPAFVATTALGSDSEPPTSANGVGVGEYLGITFSLVGGQTFNDVLADLDSGALRIGLHVQAIAPQDGSDIYVNNGRVQVPDATATIILLGAAVMGLGLLGRKLA